MYEIYPNMNPGKNPIAIARTEMKARHECVRLMKSGYFPKGLWATDVVTHKSFFVESFGKGMYLYTNTDGIEKKLDSNGNVVRKKKKEWRPFGL